MSQCAVESPEAESRMKHSKEKMNKKSEKRKEKRNEKKKKRTRGIEAYAKR